MGSGREGARINADKRFSSGWIQVGGCAALPFQSPTVQRPFSQFSCTCPLVNSIGYSACPGLKGAIERNLIYLFKSLDSSGSAEKEMDGYCLLLVFNEVQSGVWQMSYSAPAAPNGVSNVYLCRSFVPNRADQAVRIVEAAYGLVIFSAEPPHVAALAEILWA